MIAPKQTEIGNLVSEDQSTVNRRSFLKRVSVVGASGLAFGGLLNAASAQQDNREGEGLTREDTEILIAAEIAEALAVTTYTNIINAAPFFGNLALDDQGYLKNARQEEMSHYLLEQSVTGKPSPFASFFYPYNMFVDAQTTLNVLVTLEDAFIAAYLVGVRRFSTPDLRVTAARIMGMGRCRVEKSAKCQAGGTDDRNPLEERAPVHRRLILRN